MQSHTRRDVVATLSTAVAVGLAAGSWLGATLRSILEDNPRRFLACAPA